jgi:hypothetical protein
LEWKGDENLILEGFENLRTVYEKTPFFKIGIIKFSSPFLNFMPKHLGVTLTGPSHDGTGTLIPVPYQTIILILPSQDCTRYTTVHYTPQLGVGRKQLSPILASAVDAAVSNTAQRHNNRRRCRRRLASLVAAEYHLLEWLPSKKQLTLHNGGL